VVIRRHEPMLTQDAFPRAQLAGQQRSGPGPGPPPRRLARRPYALLAGPRRCSAARGGTRRRSRPAPGPAHGGHGRALHGCGKVPLQAVIELWAASARPSVGECRAGRVERLRRAARSSPAVADQHGFRCRPQRSAPSPIADLVVGGVVLSLYCFLLFFSFPSFHPPFFYLSFFLLFVPLYFPVFHLFLSFLFLLLSLFFLFFFLSCSFFFFIFVSLFFSYTGFSPLLPSRFVSPLSFCIRP